MVTRKVSRSIFVFGALIGFGILPAKVAHAWGYEMHAQHSDKCLDVDNGSTADGANVKQWSCAHVKQQSWNIVWVGDDANQEALYEVRPEHSGKCLDVDNGSTADGANVKQWTCSNVPQQRWKLVWVGGGYFELHAQHSGKCLDVAGGSTADGANVQQWTCANVPQQRWKQVYKP
jgi:Ricin-type beta-trefoil lectin domain-like